MASLGRLGPSFEGTSRPIRAAAAPPDGQARRRSGSRIGPRTGTPGLPGNRGRHPVNKQETKL